MKFKDLIEIDELYNIDFHIQVSDDIVLISFNNNYVDISIATDEDWNDWEMYHMTRDKHQIMEVLDNELDNHWLITVVFK